jgi:hypothetical protein
MAAIWQKKIINQKIGNHLNRVHNKVLSVFQNAQTIRVAHNMNIVSFVFLLVEASGQHKYHLRHSRLVTGYDG